MDWVSSVASLQPAVLAPLALTVAWLLYSVGVVVYRLYFHPLASFPGPKLAAATTWYEGYYEIILKGQYSRKISQLHDVYGPIIRVTPDEIHIRDSRFFDDVYAKNFKVDKDGWDKRFGSEHSILTTQNHALHKRRRVALSPMFSRRSILGLLDTIQAHIETFSQRIAEYHDSKQPLVLTNAFPALTGDIIMDYFFGFNYGQLKSPNFESFHEAFKAMGLSGHIATQFPSFLNIMNSIPDWVIEAAEPAAASMLQFKRDQWDLIGRTLRGEDITNNNGQRTIFQEILESKLPPEDKTQRRLADEAQIVVGGGVETTAYALGIAAFHIINTPRIKQKLYAELAEAIPNRSAAMDLQVLEKLPYLKACIMEAARLSYGLSCRNPRTHDRPVQYKQWTIPARTSISMTVPEISHDEEIFPDSYSFIPERWLGEPKTSDGIPLEKFHVSWGRGPRSCLGINLAWTEMYLTLGMMFRRYQFELYETDITDVETKHDFFVPWTRLDSEGIRVFVTGLTEK